VVGGGHPEVLRAAALHADVVGLSGLGRTLPDGHRHEVRWSGAALQRQLQVVREEARRAGRAPGFEALGSQHPGDQRPDPRGISR
jgi:hypothetical protein